MPVCRMRESSDIGCRIDSDRERPGSDTGGENSGVAVGPGNIGGPNGWRVARGPNVIREIPTPAHSVEHPVADCIWPVPIELRGGVMAREDRRQRAESEEWFQRLSEARRDARILAEFLKGFSRAVHGHLGWPRCYPAPRAAISTNDSQL